MGAGGADESLTPKFPVKAQGPRAGEKWVTSRRSQDGGHCTCPPARLRSPWSPQALSLVSLMYSKQRAQGLARSRLSVSVC